MRDVPGFVAQVCLAESTKCYVARKDSISTEGVGPQLRPDYLGKCAVELARCLGSLGEDREACGRAVDWCTVWMY